MTEIPILSFPCGGTYDLVRETLIHAHPVKRGFPTKITEYLMVRENGGASHELFRVVKILEFNPYDDDFINNIVNIDWQERLTRYISLRKDGFGFEYAPAPYRFYVLETAYRFDTPYVIENNTQGYRYFDFSQIGLTNTDVDQFALSHQIEEIDRLEIPETDRQTLIKARIKQGVFRDKLLKRYDKCCLCGVNCGDFLTASHIKPWSESRNDERLDPDNGFLLCPNHDRLFDRGYISFDDDGRITISEKLDVRNRAFLNVKPDMRINLTDGNRKYLKFHREEVFIDSQD